MAATYRRTDAAAAASRWRRRGRHLHRPRDVSDPDRGRQPSDRPDVFAARRSPERARTATRAAAGGAVRRPATHLDRPCSATTTTTIATCGRCGCSRARFDPIVVTPLGNGPLVQLGRHPPRRGARLVAGGTDPGTADHADAGAPLFGSDSVRSQSRPLGGFMLTRRTRAHLLRRGHGVCPLLP